MVKKRQKQIAVVVLLDIYNPHKRSFVLAPFLEKIGMHMRTMCNRSYTTDYRGKLINL